MLLGNSRSSGNDAGYGQAVRYGIVRKDDLLLVPIQ